MTASTSTAGRRMPPVDEQMAVLMAGMFALFGVRAAMIMMLVHE